MTRSIWKGPFSISKGLDKKNIWSRNVMIVPELIGKDIKIYNGKNWVLRKIVEEMVGHKVGEFCSTKKKVIHKITKLRQTSRKK